MRTKLLLATMLWCVTTLCETGWAYRDASAQAPDLHPNPRYIDAAIPPSFTVTVTARGATPPFRIGDPERASFGGDPAAEADFLGRVTGIVLLPDGDIAVLDDRLSELRIFGPRGESRQRLGRAGRGPGEFWHPVSLAVDGGGRLFVGDLSRALNVFSKSGMGYRHERTVRLDVAPLSMCFLDGLLVVHGTGLAETSILHLFAPSGQRERSFGAFYRSPNRVLNSRLSEGRVVCDPERHLIYFAPRRATGEVRAYRPDGTLAWRTLVTGYLVNRIEGLPRGYQVTVLDHGVHALHSLTLLPSYGLLLQVGYRDLAALSDGAPYTLLSSFLIEPASGRPRALGSALPPIAAARPGEVAVTQDDPAPAFRVRTVSRR